MNSNSLISIVSLCIGLLLTNVVNAALVPVANGKIINDTGLNVAWISDGNLAATNTFGLPTGVPLDSSGAYINKDGGMSWGGAVKWIAAMNAANYLGFSDWRLPYTPLKDPSCPGSYNCTGSEMGHLYYTELGNNGRFDTTGAPSATFGMYNYGPFTNFRFTLQKTQCSIDPFAWYWSAPAAATYSPAFNFSDGGLGGLSSGDAAVLAIRSGQVSTVPVPAAAWLFGSGLLGLFKVGRRRLGDSLR